MFMSFSSYQRKGVERKEKYSLLICLVLISNINIKAFKIFAVTDFSLWWYQVKCSVNYILFC